MARPIGLNGEEPDQISKVRIVATQSGSIAADSATLTDANYPPAADATNGGTVSCRGLRTIWLGAARADGTALAGGTSIEVEALVRDSEAADGQRWKRMLDSSGSPITFVLDGTGFLELPVYGRLVFVRVSNVTGSITQAVHLLAFPGERLQN
jgi:hypothetical protein